MNISPTGRIMLMKKVIAISTCSVPLMVNLSFLKRVLGCFFELSDLGYAFTRLLLLPDERVQEEAKSIAEKFPVPNITYQLIICKGVIRLLKE